MSEYKALKDGWVSHLNTGRQIPPDNGNRDYREYLDWVASGGVTLAMDTEPERVKPLSAQQLQKVVVELAKRLGINEADII
jgi:hypothetical protein